MIYNESDTMKQVTPNITRMMLAVVIIITELKRFRLDAFFKLVLESDDDEEEEVKCIPS